MPETTLAATPAAWSFIMLSQVTPFFDPKYLRFGRAYTEGTGTTKRMPSTMVTTPVAGAGQLPYPHPHPARSAEAVDRPARHPPARDRPCSR